ncbi:MAG: bifunctional homocysteine S-methyltransferase/methylenetetrahydrofolate reductase [Lachnospiraceae bacterium]|nr:bifunctional homocysteine S-methyltransferase/methylenetetrahydrofolate reductase [Lachnospiraceae bacterium]
MNFRDYIKQHKILTDGSFGTYYAERYQTEESPELANTLHTERVLDVHKSYIDAGATLLRTNTFATNSAYFGVDFSVVRDNLLAAVRIAEQAIHECEKNNHGKKIWIAGDIGPIPFSEGKESAEIEEEYYRIAKVFVEEGITILNFETFSSMEHILPAIRRIVAEEDVFVMVQFSVNQFGYSNAGLRAKKLFSMANAVQEIAAVGLNCGVGPAHMEQIMADIPSSDKFRIALPNAGYPKRIRNRICFSDNPVYFAEKMQDLVRHNVDIIGGCCGTTPAFIKALSEVISLKQTPHVSFDCGESNTKKSVINKSFFHCRDGSEKTKKLLAVELAPPLDVRDDKLLEAAQLMADMGVDVLTFPDSPSGRTRIDSILMAEKVHRKTGMTVMPHICCRDKNTIAIRSQLLGSYINDIHNFLVVTGDPVPSMVRQSTKAVFQFDSVGLMQMLRDMNEEMFENTPMFYGGAINHNRHNLDIEIKRVKRKMEAGASFFLTQPVFCEEDIRRLRTIKEQTNARILCGIMPLVSYKNACFMKNEIAGVSVTDEVVARYNKDATREEGEAIGIAIAKEMMQSAKDFADGYYFSFPFNRVYMLPSILEDFGE